MVVKTDDSENAPLWDLEDLYQELADPQLQKDKEAVETSIHLFKKKYEKIIVSLSGEALAESIELYESICEKIARIQSYADLSYAVAQTSCEVNRFAQDIEEWASDQAKKLVFFELELNEYAFEDSLYKETPALEIYRSWIEKINALKAHQLSESLEQLSQDYRGPACQAWIKLYDETLASLKVKDQKGHFMSLSQSLDLLSSPDEKRRSSVAKELSRALSEKAPVWVRVYNTLMKEHSIETQWRRFQSAPSSRHLKNQIGEESVKALECSVKAAYGPMSHRYYQLKAKIMGLPHLNYWDRCAPIFSKNGLKEKTYTWEDAKNLVLEAYGDFCKEFKSIGEMFFDKGWIHARPMEGKDSGAFCHPVVPSLHPYIMMNFYGKNRDVMTLAHELGHGIHQWLSRQQRFFMADAPLTIAETASVFGEKLVFEKLLSSCETSQEKLLLLSQKIEDMLNTVMRQIGFYQFEQRAHEKRLQGELSKEDFGRIWLEIQAEVLGGGVILSPDYGIYWAYISHFIHSPFYVYAYAFGECVVNALYDVYKKGYVGFKDGYLDFLQKGSSQKYSAMLAPFNLNPQRTDFWEKGVAPIGVMIDELERLFYAK